LTEERRKELVKVVRKMGEATKVSLRNLRRKQTITSKDSRRIRKYPKTNSTS